MANPPQGTDRSGGDPFDNPLESAKPDYPKLRGLELSVLTAFCVAGIASGLLVIVATIPTFNSCFDGTKAGIGPCPSLPFARGALVALIFGVVVMIRAKGSNNSVLRRFGLLSILLSVVALAALVFTTVSNFSIGM